MSYSANKIRLVGKVFGKLKVLGFFGVDKFHNTRWLCLCECGNTCVRVAKGLKGIEIPSCGCRLRLLRTKHGSLKTSTYGSWRAMRQRTQNPNHREFRNYGARGILVCDRWQLFINFLKDMGERPAGTSLDRIDNSKGYEPGNCRWATPSEQSQNTRRTVFLEMDGKRQTRKEWAREMGLSSLVIESRIKRGWSVKEALTTPRLIANKHGAFFVTKPVLIYPETTCAVRF